MSELLGMNHKQLLKRWLAMYALAMYAQPGRAAPFDLFAFAVDCRDSVPKANEARILVSDPLEDNTRQDRGGRVWVVSARSGAPILHVDGDGTGDRFGSAVAFVDDLDGDGITDFVVAATHHLKLEEDGVVRSQGSEGYLRWFSGKDGRILHALNVPTIAELAPALATIQDLDGDGKRELLVGLPSVKHDGRSSGAVFVFSSKDYSRHFVVFGPKDCDRLGVCVAEIRDINHDGASDFAATGVPSYDPHNPEWPTNADRKRERSGRVFLYSGKDGSLIRELSPPRAEGVFGTALAGGMDLDGDNVPDLVVTLSDPNSKSTVFAYSGASGKVIREWSQRNNIQFGRPICLAGDLNADSVPDVVIGERSLKSEGSSAWIVSGREDASIRVLDSVPKGSEWSTEGGFWAGISLCSVSDQDGDGVRDIIVGATNITGLGNPGSVHLFSGKSGKCIWGTTRSLLDGPK